MRVYARDNMDLFLVMRIVLYLKAKILMAYKVTLVKGQDNVIGVSIGGGSPWCPVLYVVQVFHRTPAAEDGSLQPGDELVSVNGTALTKCSRKEAANMIQEIKGPVIITYNRNVPLKEKKSLDIAIKKLKHKLVEKLNEETADNLGISRAILIHDTIAKKVEQMENNEAVVKGLLAHSKQLLEGHKHLVQAYDGMFQVFSTIGVHERQKSASLAFSNFGTAHRAMQEEGVKMIKKIEPILKDLSVFLEKAIPDTRLTIKKYSDAKYEYLAYCLKVKEMDDMEINAAHQGLILIRVVEGNLEYRELLASRHRARQRYSKMRSDTLIKLQLLDNKRVQDLVFHLKRMITAYHMFTRHCHRSLQQGAIFPIQPELIGLGEHQSEPEQPLIKLNENAGNPTSDD